MKMYKNWLNYSKEHPYKSILIAVFLGSIVGILIEYLINRDIVFDGVWALITVVLLQLYFVRKKSKK